MLGDSEAVEYVSLDAETRFTALQAGDIDVLIRNTTFTASRDGAERSRFLTTTFYDGQGMMVRADSGYGSIADMDGTTICVLSGTTTELNLATAAAAAGIDYEPLTFDGADQIQEAFIAGQCQGWTSDKSQLAGVRSAFPPTEGGPEGLTILDETFSKEPLGPVVLDGDDEWAAAVNWAVIATIQAEEFGITTANVEDMTSEREPRHPALPRRADPRRGPRGRGDAVRSRPGPRCRLRGERDLAGGQLRRDLRPHGRRRHRSRARSGAQRPVHRRWPDLRSALPVMAIG